MQLPLAELLNKPRRRMSGGWWLGLQGCFSYFPCGPLARATFKQQKFSRQAGPGCIAALPPRADMQWAHASSKLPHSLLKSLYLCVSQSAKCHLDVAAVSEKLPEKERQHASKSCIKCACWHSGARFQAVARGSLDIPLVALGGRR